MSTQKATDKQIGGDHYKRMAIQPIEFIMKNEIPFAEACVIKYVCRHQFKNGLEDIEKAIHYLELIKDQMYTEKKEVPYGHEILEKVGLGQFLNKSVELFGDGAGNVISPFTGPEEMKLAETWKYMTNDEKYKYLAGMGPSITHVEFAEPDFDKEEEREGVKSCFVHSSCLEEFPAMNRSEVINELWYERDFEDHRLRNWENHDCPSGLKKGLAFTRREFLSEIEFLSSKVSKLISEEEVDRLEAGILIRKIGALCIAYGEAYGLPKRIVEDGAKGNTGT